MQPKSEAKLPPPATNDSSSPSLMKEEELGPLHIDIQPVSPISSIEVLSPPTNDDGSMSSSHTTTLASSQEIREPGEGQEDEEPSLCNSQLLQEAVKESKLDHISEASSSSKSYEIINSSGKTSKPSQQNSSCSGDEFDMATTSSDIEIISNEAARVVSPRVSKSKVNRLGKVIFSGKRQKKGLNFRLDNEFVEQLKSLDLYFDDQGLHFGSFWIRYLV